MEKYIKSRDSFSSGPINNDTNEAFSFTDILSKGLEFLGSGISNTIKQKITAYLLEYLGIKEESPLSVVVQEVVEEIDISEYAGIISGKNANMDFFIPKFSEALVEFLQRTGFDGIAESLGMDKKGYLYNITRESISEKLSKSEDLKKDIEKFLKSVFDSKSSGRKLEDFINPEKISKDLNPSDRENLIDKIEGNIEGSDKKGGTATDYLSGLLSGAFGGFTAPKSTI